MYHKGIIAILAIVLSVSCLRAQNAFSDNEADTVHHHVVVPEETYPKFKVGGLFQARYLYSKKNNVDVEGLQHSDGEFVSNTYEIKRMRVSMNASLTKNLSVVTLVNLSDFKQDPKTRVLENAYAQYNVNRYLKYQVGQFRPAFGIEDSHPVDIVKSIDWSNAYYLLGSNGWQSFQVGAGITGSVDLGKVPLNYSASMTNGNGKNKIADNNGKHYSSRFWFDINPKRKLTLGFSTGFGTEHKQDVHAFGLEGTYRLTFTDKLSIQFQAEAVQAINHSLYFSLAEDKRQGPLHDYVLRDVYVLPNLRYVIGKQHLQAVDFSCRYEYLDANYKLDSNPRQTLVPMASVEFLKDYGARLQFGVQIDNYKKNIANTKTYDANLYFLQFQCRLQ